VLLSRRDVLLLAAGGLVTGCGGKSAATPDAPAQGACFPTRADVLGPYFLAGAPMRMAIADPSEPGERLTLTGRIRGPDCAAPLEGVGIEVWQADRDGNYHTVDRLRGRATTLADGMFRVETVRPGNYLQGTGYRPAHVHFTFARPGYKTLTTQIYFSDDAYLAPVDSCTTCGSDDKERILVLAGNASAGWSGTLEIILAAA
jgi:catechol 1,2-dioxygenase